MALLQCLPLLLLSTASAMVEVLDSATPAPIPKVFAKGTGPICGGDAIRQFITPPANSYDIRSIPWAEVEAVAANFIRSQGVEISNLEAEVKRLREDIPRREASEAPVPLPAKQLGEAVAAAVKAPSSFGTVELAAASKCGGVFTQPRPQRGAHKAARVAFEAGIKSVLASKKFRTTSLDVRTSCRTLLGVIDGNDSSASCSELCQELAEIAQDASDSAAGVLAANAKGSEQLRKDEREKSALLAAAVSDLEQCRQLQADLGIFKGQLKSLAEDIKDKGKKCMDARDLLQDAQEELEGMEETLTSQLSAAKMAADCLSVSGQEAEAVQAQLLTVEEHTDVLKATIQAASTQLESAKQDVKKVELTVELVFRLKKAVSDSMLSMVMYFDEAVRKPIRDMGLGEKVDVDDLFPSLLSSLPSAKATKGSMKAIDNFCGQQDTKKVLAAVATPERDPQQLCTIGNVANLETDIDEAVADRVASLKDSLRGVQSWLCPYRGQPEIDHQVVARHIQAGEPVGLREVLSTFGRTAFYQQYLRHWMLKGRFLKLYEALVAAHRTAKETHEQALARVDAVAEELKETEAVMASAQEALQHAVDQQVVAEGKQSEAQQALEMLSNTQLQLKRDLSALEDAAKEAERLWQEAMLTLEAAHREGVSLVQLLQELEDAGGQA